MADLCRRLRKTVLSINTVNLVRTTPAILPDWDAALRHVKAAHNACFNFVFVGWDVAFTPDGPMILEGNTNWSPGTYQTLSGKPLGLTKFADILATQLSRKRRGKYSILTFTSGYRRLTRKCNLSAPQLKSPAWPLFAHIAVVTAIMIVGRSRRDRQFS